MRGLTPCTSDAAALERKRAALAAKLARHADRVRRCELGTASDATRRCVANGRHLAQVLAGPVALGPARSRGFVGVAVCLVLVIVSAGILSDTAARHRAASAEGCAELFAELDAGPGRIRAAWLRRAISRNYCERGQNAE